MTSANPKAIKASLIIVWMAAAICAGIGVGLVIVHNNSSLGTLTPFPVATESLSVAQTMTPPITDGQAASPMLIGMTTGSSVNQATAGSPFKVASTSFMHPATTNSSFQPGFQFYGSIQGNTGTAAVPSI